MVAAWRLAPRRRDAACGLWYGYEYSSNRSAWLASSQEFPHKNSRILRPCLMSLMKNDSASSSTAGHSHPQEIPV
jgi:hypothetical protein